ncbi:FkbM family methyltransferase [Flavobacteriaceae bacterium]|nr:FkbM family methyltransferase [Flavobacteriaceae bacterium]
MIKKIINFIAKTILFLLKNKAGSYILDSLLKQQFNTTKTIRLNQNSILELSVPNRLTMYRAKTYFTKEPETIEWLDEIKLNSIVWDIGANVGLYSLYAAKQRNCDIVAFEPSVFNLELLARNISKNNLSDKITIIPLALSDREGSGLFNMSNPEWGGALSTFDKKFDQYGNTMDVKFNYSIQGVSGDSMVNKMGLTQPDYLKIDVDGVEHFILSGMQEILPKVKSVIIEINDEFEEQLKITQELLIKAGFTLKKKCVEGVPKGVLLFNQWWVNKNIQ